MSIKNIKSTYDKNSKSSKKSQDSPAGEGSVKSRKKESEFKGITDAGKSAAEANITDSEFAGNDASGLSQKSVNPAKSDKTPEMANSAKEKPKTAQNKKSEQSQNQIYKSDKPTQVIDESLKNNTDFPYDIREEIQIQFNPFAFDDFLDPVTHYRNDLFEPYDEDLKVHIYKIRKEMQYFQWTAALKDVHRAISLFRKSPLPYLYFIACSEPIGNIFNFFECSVKNGLSHYNEFQSALLYSNKDQRNFLCESNLNSMYNYVKSKIVTITDPRKKFILITSQYRYMFLFIKNNIISEKIRNKGFAFMYRLCCEALANVQTYSEAEQVSHMFSQISEFGNSAEVAEKCYDIYGKIVLNMIQDKNTPVEKLEEKYNELSTAREIKNHQQLRIICREKIDSLKPNKNSTIIHQRHKKSQKKNIKIKKLLYIAGCIVIAFVALRFTITGISKLKDNKPKDKSHELVDENSVNEETTQLPEAATVTESVNTTQPATKAENNEVSDEPVAVVDTSEEAMQALQQYMNSETEHNSSFALYDVNADGIKELFIQYPNPDGGTSSYIYTYKNGNYEKSFSFGNIYINLKEHLIMEKIYDGGETTKLYSLTDDEIQQKDEFKMLYDAETNYFHNDSAISKDDYNRLMSAYSSVDWVSISDISKPVSSLIEISTTTTSTTQTTTSTTQITTTTAKATTAKTQAATSKTQTTTSKTQATTAKTQATTAKAQASTAPITTTTSPITTTAQVTTTTATTTSNNPSTGEFIATGKVVTDSDPLNLRSAPDTNGVIICQIPKGDRIEIYSVHGNWLYAKYSADNIPAYYGYVSKDYVDITWLDANNTQN